MIFIAIRLSRIIKMQIESGKNGNQGINTVQKAFIATLITKKFF